MLPNTKGNVEWLGEKEVKARLGFDPEYVVDFKGLKGDPSDNIPGVKGIGDKGAVKLIEEFGTLENIYAHLDEVTPESTRKKLEADEASALMSKNLATIIRDVPIDFNLENCKYTVFSKLEVKRELEKHNFKSLIRRLGLEPDADKKPADIVHENQVGLF